MLRFVKILRNFLNLFTFSVLLNVSKLLKLLKVIKVERLIKHTYKNKMDERMDLWMDRNAVLNTFYSKKNTNK
jgi:hypothetical protein